MRSKKITSQIQDLLNWLNSKLPPTTPPVQIINQLASGVAYLTLLSKVDAKANIGRMICDPEEKFESAHNFKILAENINIIDKDFIIDIFKLTKGCPRQNLRLLKFLYNHYEGQIQIQSKINQDQCGERIIKRQLQPYQVVTLQQKMEQTMITTDELSKLMKNQTKKKMMNNCAYLAKIQRNGNQEQRQFGHQGEVTQDKLLFQDDNIDHSSATSQELTDKNRKNFLEQELEYQFQKSQIKNISDWDILNSVGRTTVRYLRTISVQNKFKKEFEDMLDKYSKIKKRRISPSYIFFGSQSFNDESKQKNPQLRIKYQGARNFIRKTCHKYYKTAQFVKKSILLNSFLSFKRKISMINLLQNILRQTYKKDQDIQEQQQFLRRQKKQLKQQQIVNQSNKQFWSVHRRTLIAFQLKFIKNQTHNSIDLNEKYYQKGFLFGQNHGTKSYITQKKFSQRSSFRNLSELFSEEQIISSQFIRLRDFLDILLQLKNLQMQVLFIDIYDQILGNIRDIIIDKLRDHSIIMLEICKVTEKIKKNAQNLQQLLSNKYGIDANLDGILKLIKVTMYCIIADALQLKDNPYHQKTFNVLYQREIGKKERQKIVEKNIEIKGKSIRNIIKCKLSIISHSKKCAIIFYITNLILNFLKNLKKSEQLQSEATKIIKNMQQSCKTGFYLLQYFFFGKTKITSYNRRFQNNLNENFEMATQARIFFRQQSNQYLKSFQLIKQIYWVGFKSLQNIYYLLKYLPNIELLPTNPKWTRDEFFVLNIFSKQESTELADNNLQQMKKSNKNKLGQSSLQKSNLNSSLFWTDHKIVLIAFQHKYIFDKKIINPKKLNQNKFRNKYGFSLQKRQQASSNNDIEDTAKNYKNLKIFFNKKCKQHFLKEFIVGMLSLKHAAVRQIFMSIYDQIIGDILIISYKQIFSKHARFKVINKMVVKLQDDVAELNKFFVDECGFESDMIGIMKLMQVTVYCFLAEMHEFTQNQYYAQVFKLGHNYEEEEQEQEDQGVYYKFLKRGMSNE